MAHKNVQNHVVVISNPQGKIWAVGTDTKRGFTAKGAEIAEARLEAHLPHGWKVEIRELYPISEALAFRR
jgi:hypothetical protein